MRSKQEIVLKNRVIDKDKNILFENRRFKIDPDVSQFFVLRMKEELSPLKKHELRKMLKIDFSTHFIHDDTFVTKNSLNELIKVSDHLQTVDFFSGDDKTIHNRPSSLHKDIFSGINIEVKIRVIFYENILDDNILSYYKSKYSYTQVNDKVFIVTTTYAHLFNTIESLKDEEHVLWIEIISDMSTMNYGAKQIYFNNPKSPEFYDMGITGKDQVIGICDTGIDVKNCFFHDDSEKVIVNQEMHEHRKIKYYHVFKESNVNVPHDTKGHGSHTSASLAGSIEKSNPNATHIDNYNGIAPDAKIVFHHCHVNGSLYVPEDIYNRVLKKAYNLGARIHSNSWGAHIGGHMFSCHYDCKCAFSRKVGNYSDGDPVPPEFCQFHYGTDRCCESGNRYTHQCSEIDKFLYDHDDMVVLFAMGNYGQISKFGSIVSPATSKNVISVGASQTTRENFQYAVDWIDFEVYYDYIHLLNFSICLPDCCHDHCIFKEFCCIGSVKEKYAQSHNYYNRTNMAEFSSRGMTHDGRIKPEVVGPGDKVVSAHSSRLESTNPFCGIEPDPIEGPEMFEAMIADQGTSMATPLTAGLVALVREFLNSGKIPKLKHVSGYLVKGMMVHAAEKLNGMVKYGNFDMEMLPNNSPNLYYGYGLPNVEKYLIQNRKNPNYFLKIIDRQHVSSERNFDTFVFKKINDSPFFGPLEITISYYDHATPSFATSIVVNNLQLVVTVGEKIYYGNNNLHDINPIKKVTISDVKNNDDIYVTVSGNKIQSMYQNFAMIVTGYGIKDMVSCFGILATENHVCNGHGICKSLDRCNCTRGYGLDDCSYYTCGKYGYNDTVNVCSGNGNCTDYDNCKCKRGYYNSECEKSVNPSNWVVYLSIGFAISLVLLLVIICVTAIFFMTVYMQCKKKIFKKRSNSYNEILDIDETEEEIDDPLIFPQFPEKQDGSAYGHL